MVNNAGRAPLLSTGTTGLRDRCAGSSGRVLGPVVSGRTTRDPSPAGRSTAARISSRVGGVLARCGGFGVFFAVVVLVGVGSGRSSVRRSVVRVFVGCWVGREWASASVSPSSSAPAAAWSALRYDGSRSRRTGSTHGRRRPGRPAGHPSRRRTGRVAVTAQTLTPRKSTRAAAPAYTIRRDGPAYRPIGPRTGLPLPSTQNFQSSGGGGQDGSGRQVFGGTQLRRGGDGQVGGTTNRFKKLPHLRLEPWSG